ncbi:S41 family peptidase [Brevundimonas faecalis]|uniref:Tail specific protease domain-containing protein n=1 Tax=Brevundimonas faecalis TaxID=947378 RepID=A0ABV2R7V4_9CAUL
MRQAITVALLSLSAMIAEGAAAQDRTQPVLWGQALREDAQAFHDLIANNHPGPIDAANPAFNVSLEAGLALALDRAQTADSYAAWRAALTEYAASFNDGHLGLTQIEDSSEPVVVQWPGFLVGLRSGEAGERYEVVYSRDTAAPPVGAVLEDCDGRSAEALGYEMIGREVGRWSLHATRVSHAVWTFVDAGNPYVQRARQCRFDVDGRRTTHTLTWRPLDPTDRDAGIATANGERFTASTLIRPWSGGMWLELGDFGADPRTAGGERLTDMLADAETRVAQLRGAPVLVFDLRGNNGGSSTWLTSLARTIWGADYVDARVIDDATVDWRASADNLAKLESYVAQFSSQPETLAYLNTLIDGMRSAMAEGELLFHEPKAPSPAPTTTLQNPVAGKIYVLTDFGCSSACLDAVDTLTALGAVQVGQETSADTLYNEIRYVPLPSGRATAYVPMKVYRERLRANNEPAVPTHVWAGPIADTTGIENWIAHLKDSD